MIGPPPDSPLFPSPPLSRPPPAEPDEHAVGFQAGLRMVEVGVVDVREPRIDGPRPRGSRTSTTPTSTIRDRKSTRLNSSHDQISYAVFCLKKKKKIKTNQIQVTIALHPHLAYTT